MDVRHLRGDLAIDTVPCTDAGIESAQRAMLPAAANAGAITVGSPEHARSADPRLAAHAGLVGAAQISMVHNSRAGALARAVASELDGSAR